MGSRNVNRVILISTLTAASLTAYARADAPITITCADISLEYHDLETAQAKVRELKNQGKLTEPVEVVLPEGTYTLSEPLRFTPEDSGTETAPITYRAEKPGTVTISGGRHITGWQPGEHGAWQALLPEVRDGKLYFRQLFVNGRRATRARSPNQGFYYTTGLIKKPEHTHRQADGFYFAGDAITAETAADPDMLLVVYQSWLSRQYRLKEFKPEIKAVTTEPEMDIYRERSRFLVENTLECLDAPGEWYLDRKTGIVRYIPFPGEDMTTTTVIAPVTRSLLQFKGNPEAGEYVEYLHFRGIRFAHADWTVAGRSITNGQGRCPMGFEDPDVVLESGAISAIGLRHSAIENCEITQVGAHALCLLGGCTDNTVSKCHIHNLGGGGVYLYWSVPQPGKRPSWNPRGDFDHVEHNTVDNCYIHDMTHIFNGSVGILTGPCAAYNRITHNEVSYGDYTGISIGWGWSANKKSGQYQDGNVVEYNHVHHVMNYLLDDGGAIYLLGWQKDARICYNWIHDVRHDPLGHGAKGIYPDQGTSGVLFEGNIVHDVVQGFGGNGGHESMVRNNIFACSQKSGVIGGGKFWTDQVRLNPNPIVFENNILYQQDATAMLMRTGYAPDVQISRNNVYWAGPDAVNAPLFSGADLNFVTFTEWQAAGHDTGSVMADPLFVDAAGRDFRLRPESPALKMGFIQTDISKVGLYGDSEWVNLPKTVKHAPIAPLPGPGGLEWTYEDEVAGAPPVHSGHLAPGPAELEHGILVTNEDAASGSNCLKFSEGKNSERGFFPFLYYAVGVSEGPVNVSFRIKMLSATPSAMYLEFRDYNNVGNKHYQAGPHIEINPQGILKATEGADVSLQLPRDQWIDLGMTFSTGVNAPKTFDLTVAWPGAAPKTCRALPFVDAGFTEAGDIYIVSTGPDGGVFLIDDVRISTP